MFVQLPWDRANVKGMCKNMNDPYPIFTTQKKLCVEKSMCNTAFTRFNMLYVIIRIYHEYKGGIEKSVLSGSPFGIMRLAE